MAHTKEVEVMEAVVEVVVMEEVDKVIEISQTIMNQAKISIKEEVVDEVEVQEEEVIGQINQGMTSQVLNAIIVIVLAIILGNVEVMWRRRIILRRAAIAKKI